MAGNVNYTDVLATTIESRTGKLADNVTKNNALLYRLNERGNRKPVSGGSKILVKDEQAVKAGDRLAETLINKFFQR